MKKVEQASYREPLEPHKHDNHALVIHARPARVIPNLVVLIHGLTGHRYGYWGKMPKFIFDDIADADVGLYYYRTALKRLGFFKSIDLEEEAKVLADELRRLKFYGSITLVGHSMGGLLAKAAIKSLIDRDFQSHLRKISGLILLASPQLGSLRVPSWLRLFSRDGRALQPHNKLIRAIDTAFSTRLNLDQMADPRDKFTIPTWAVIGAEDFWVDALSAGVGIPEEQRLTVRGRHGDVKSPSDKEDEAYEFVRDCVEGTFKPKLDARNSEEQLRVEDATISDVLAIRAIATSFFGMRPANAS